MALYICTSEQAVDQARLAGCRPGQGDILLLIHDAVAIHMHGCGVIRAADDLAMRGGQHTDDAVDNGQIIDLISENHKVWVL